MRFFNFVRKNDFDIKISQILASQVSRKLASMVAGAPGGTDTNFGNLPAMASKKLVVSFFFLNIKFRDCKR